MKTAKNSKEASEIEEKQQGNPHGWIQWKGTSVCMDIRCECGHSFHVDAEFVYHVKCGSCGAVYYCNPHIELIKIEEEPENCVYVDDVDDVEYLFK